MGTRLRPAIRRLKALPASRSSTGAIANASSKEVIVPEGDTIHRTAVTLRKVLPGCIIEATEGWPDRIDYQSLVGATVDDVEARGKHLLVQLHDGRVIHGHSGMTGSWHVYAPGQPWSKPTRRAALVLRTSHAVVVFFNPKLLELLSPHALRRHRWLQQLGPDLLARHIDYDLIVARFRKRDTLPLGEAVMNQAICSGIGNVYKSELLFLMNLDPFAPVAAVANDKLRDLLELARELLEFNLQGPKRTTRFEGDGGRLWVYGRRGEPCYLCGRTIQLSRQGDAGRTTYWCPECQTASQTVSQNKPRSDKSPRQRRPPIRGC